jgi:hypothetical protein
MLGNAYFVHNKWGKRTLSAEGEQVFRSLWTTDVTIPKIAETLGVPLNGGHWRAIRRMRARLGLAPRHLSMRVRRGLPQLTKKPPRPRVVPNPERIANLREMWAAGASWHSMCEGLKMGHAMLRRLVRELNLPKRPRPNVWHEWQKDFVAENWGTLSQEEIAKHIGRSVRGCQNMAAILDLTPRAYRWTTDMVNTLFSLHEQGFSYAVIAARLGVTKNAAVGKGNRLGIKSARSIKPKQTKAERAARERTWRKNRKQSLPRAPKLRATEARALAAPSDAPPSNHVSLIENDGCRWPTDPGYCGHKLYDKRYCHYHAEKSRLKRA